MHSYSDNFWSFFYVYFILAVHELRFSQNALPRLMFVGYGLRIIMMAKVQHFHLVFQFQRIEFALCIDGLFYAAIHTKYTINSYITYSYHYEIQKKPGAKDIGIIDDDISSQIG
jgi:hypothetical protein